MKTRIEDILEKISLACDKSARKTSDVKLMAVSKFHPVEEILQAYDCGLKLYGENRVQEACSKFSEILQIKPDVDLHLIGSLQRNKVKNIVPICSCIQSLDRIELAQEIQKQCEKIGKKINVLFEIHTGEDSKSGYQNIDDVKKTLDYILSLENSFLVPTGFMTMAPLGADKVVVREIFRKMHNIYVDISTKKYDNVYMEYLSMGMSNDFETAIEEGANIIRVGSKMFKI